MVIINHDSHATKKLYEAAVSVLQGLHARINAAPDDAKPVFTGIAELHDAIGVYERSYGMSRKARP